MWYQFNYDKPGFNRCGYLTLFYTKGLMEENNIKEITYK